MNCGREKTSIGFVILNYNEWQLTKKCIDSIMTLRLPDRCADVQIVVVDNASPNNSGILLKGIYEPVDRDDHVDNRFHIHVILNDKNSGFSSGNNVGYKYLKDNYDSDFIIAVNSDVLFIQHQFITILYELYENYPFHVAGPDIIVRDRSLHQNPRMVIKDYPSVEQILIMKKNWGRLRVHYANKDIYAIRKYILERFRHKKTIKLLVLAKRNFDRARVSLRNKMRHLNIVNEGNNSDIENPETDINSEGLYRKQNENVCLQGPCIIFDNRYISERDVLFNPLTFMYLEEQILSLDCYLNNWKTLYFPQLLVEHLDGGSTYTKSEQYFDEFCNKRKQTYYMLEESADIYLEYLQSYDVRVQIKESCND